MPPVAAPATAGSKGGPRAGATPGLSPLLDDARPCSNPPSIHARACRGARLPPARSGKNLSALHPIFSVRPLDRVAARNYHCRIQVVRALATDEQLELPLPRPKPTWGGARAGAGRKRSNNGRVSHAPRPALSKHRPVHVTLRMRDEVYGLRSRRSFRAVEKSLRALNEASDIRVVHYSVQGDHVHLIVEASDRVCLSRRIQGFEVRLAFALNRMMKRPRGRVFADRYHAHVLKTPAEAHHAIGYVLRNAAKHFGTRTTFADPYSSASAFTGWSAPIRVAWSPVSPGPPLVREPSSWLLRVGWKTHGHLDPRLVPGRSASALRSKPQFARKNLLTAR
jgi:putative transposase